MGTPAKMFHPAPHSLSSQKAPRSREGKGSPGITDMQKEWIARAYCMTCASQERDWDTLECEWDERAFMSLHQLSKVLCVWVAKSENVYCRDRKELLQ